MFNFDVGLNISVVSVHYEGTTDLGNCYETISIDIYIFALAGGIAWDPSEGDVEVTVPSLGGFSGGVGIDYDYK